MNRSEVFDAGDFSPIKNGIALSSNTSIEWKESETPLATASVVEIDGRKAVSIKTVESGKWIRLHVKIAPEALTIVGTSYVISISGKTPTHRVKPAFVRTNIRSDSRSEFPNINSSPINLRNGAWYDISGAVLGGRLPAGQRLDIILDLPFGVEIILAEVKFETFEVSLNEQKSEDLKAKSILPFSSFAATEVKSIEAWLSSPALFLNSVRMDGAKISGSVLSSAKSICISRSSSEGLIEVPLSGPVVADGVELPSGGFEHSFDRPIQPLETISLFSANDKQQPFWKGAHSASQPPAKAVTAFKQKKSAMARDRQSNTILLWGPIATAGLTVQLEQVVKILLDAKFDFQISYHMQPQPGHPLSKYWVEPRDIDQPKLLIYFERMVEFDRGFDSAFKVFYMNLDWLSSKIVPIVKTYANLVLCPTPYRLSELEETFSNSKVIHLPWPSKFKPRASEEMTDRSKPIRILYVGNDYDEISRKHPIQVVEAIGRLKRTDIVIDLKFRNALPPHVLEELQKNPCVDRITDWSTDHSFVEELYAQADINLIPNACEGNGLSILEAWASGTVPAVLNGHPMIDVTTEENSYRIACHQDGNQEYAPYYRTTADDILHFLNELNWDDVVRRKAVVRSMAGELLEREKLLAENIISCAMLSGVRTKGIRLRVEEAHLPSERYAGMEPRGGDRVKDLLFKDEGQKALVRTPHLIDVLLTTSRRPWCLRETLRQLLRAIRNSPFQHRLFVAVDNVDPGTLAILNEHCFEIDQIIWTKEKMGLPYTWNSLKDLQKNTVNRTEVRPDYICYIQDDCYIKDPDTYFAKMAGIANEVMPGYLGFVSGFYTEVHPGFSDFEWNGNRVIASDSIDGKNFMARPEVLESTGKLTWWFNDGMRRGNPGPVRGSHFDLWQWKESPNSLTAQSRISLVLPDLCSHSAEKAEESTWNNNTTMEAVQKRVDERRIYQTRTYKDKR